MFDELPGNLVEIVSALDPKEGRKWLADLPALVDAIAENWSLSVGEPFPNLSYHYVAPCLCADGSEAVLKIGFPGEQKTLFNEAKMLEFIGGRGLVELLRMDENRFALLLEKLEPGENLKTICRGDAARATQIAIRVMRELWREPPPPAADNNSFQKLEDWFEGFTKAEKTDFNSDYLKKARSFYEELTAVSTRRMLLHGDLHHENILSAKREPFLAIDPKGIIGDVGYEASPFLINQARWLSGEPDLKEKLTGTIRQLSEGLEIGARDLRKWAFAQAVLSAWWTFEDNSGDWKAELAFARVWEE